jgi:hypothetical protein
MLPPAALGRLWCSARPVPLCRNRWPAIREPSEAEADIELKTITQQLEQARQQEQAIAGRLTALEKRGRGRFAQPRRDRGAHPVARGHGHRRGRPVAADRSGRAELLAGSTGARTP